MSIQIEALSSVVDVSATTADTTTADTALACAVARAYRCAAVVVNPCFLGTAMKKLSTDDHIVRATTTAFPFGCELTAVKIYAVQQSALSGAGEIDMVMNTGAFLSGDTALVQREVALVKGCVDIPLKVIIEAPLLSNEQIAEAAETVTDAGADWICTGTGLNGSASTDQVRIICETVRGKAKVKAAGGIRTIKDMTSLIDAGAQRLGIPVAAAQTVFQEIDHVLGRPSPDIIL